MNEIQLRIKNRRIELGLTLKDVAQKLGVSEATVSRYESGNIANMGTDKLGKLAKALRCTPGYLIGWEDTPQFGEGYETARLYLNSEVSPSVKLQFEVEELLQYLNDDNMQKVKEYIEFLLQKQDTE